MSWRGMVLVNANEMKPPVAPLALDYIGGQLEAAGVDVRVIDLTFAGDVGRALAKGLVDVDPIAIGVSFRNTDDCVWPSGDCFVPRLEEILGLIRSATAAPVVLGGCGFNIFPAVLMNQCDADFGIVGNGEDVLVDLARRLETARDHRDVPGLLYRDDAGCVAFNPPDYGQMLDLAVNRNLIDNARYLREGAMGNIETKRGCPQPCLYCADPVARGQTARCRDPRQVADEIESLLRQRVDMLHLCDGEFNIPPEHALAVCEAIIDRGLGDRVRWYCYASVHPFSAELALAMKRAGCVGVNFGADSACDRMLDVLKRGYHREAVREAVQYCKSAGMAVMIDLLLGGPGETEASVRETIAFAKAIDPDRCGAATGIRVYPGTELARMVHRAGPLADNPDLHGRRDDNDDLLWPVFFIDHRLGKDAGALVCDMIDGDDRFFPPMRAEDAVDHNYNDNSVLIGAIAAGHRGAFWDILRHIAE